MNGPAPVVTQDLAPQELSPDVPPLVRLGIHLLHRVHPQIEDIWNARIILLVPPAPFRFDADMHLPVVEANRHQVGFVVVEVHAAR